ncbi:TPA: hypothetical protein H1005_04540 [archaeon]|uniref:Uncharacterized protein n=1 Tax=Candidatus Naiadarchaeum limnaeum TaxID=2756139 RepID=A0A832V2A9_9ARCH|nr:hypothetical protein [Candidatus Naiadarchaeales archaeon SRR2090153.bin1042]HIK01008.1 hypothetical protein [Candidatus Naiadarchaeum limnaeum]
MELKLDFGKEKVLEFLFIIIVALATIIASFGNILLAAAFGLLAILAIGVIFILIAKD